jgi:hypothetical protein
VRLVGGLAASVLACTVGALQAAEPIRLAWDGSRISIQTEAPMPLAQLLGQMAQSTGITIAVHGDPGTVRPISLAPQRLDHALLALAAGHDTALRFATTGSSAAEPRLVAAWVVVRQSRPLTAPTPARKVKLGELVAAGAAGVPALARVLTSHPDPATRERAARGLAQVGGSTALSALRQGLHDRDPTVRLRAAQGLARSGTRDALARLKAATALERDASVKAVLERLMAPLS